MVIDNLRSNADLAQKIVAMAAERVGAQRPPSDSHHALRHALMTPQAAVPPETRQRTELFTTPYWGPYNG
jgi:5'-methylthioadenosine phosphorylase